MQVYGSWHWFTSSTILSLLSLHFYWADPQGHHMMAAADPDEQDKDYFHYQAIPHLPARGNHCSNIYHHRLILPFLEPHINGVTQYAIFCVWLLPFNMFFV